MKIRTDFVTNSSSSSFIIARKGDLTEEQKERILAQILPDVLGSKVLDADSTEEEIQEVIDDYAYYDEQKNKIREALGKGMDVYCGYIYHEYDMTDYSEIAEMVWDELEKDPETFMGIQTNLDY